MPIKLTDEILTAAIMGFEEQKKQIDAQIAALLQTRTGAPAEPEAAAPRRKRRKLSAAGRRAIIEATKRRWEKFRAAKKAKA